MIFINQNYESCKIKQYKQTYLLQQKLNLKIRK